MFVGKGSTDANGLVLFEPTLLRARYGGHIAPKTDLFTRYTTTDEGDEVLMAGLIVPVLAITDAGYDVVVRLSSEPWEPPGRVLVENKVYPLRVRERLVLADLAVLLSWLDDTDWQDVPVPPGCYSVTVRGFRELSADGKTITRAGYEFVLDPRDTLPALTADTGRNMQVLRFDPPEAPGS